MAAYLVFHAGNHPSPYGGYIYVRFRCTIVLESSLPIRRVLPGCDYLCLTIRAIPPHMEGTSCQSAFGAALTNHPPIYGGYDPAICSSAAISESSLPIRRVLSSLRIWRVRAGIFAYKRSARIIPPHMEGTEKSYDRTLWYAESSLRIWRVQVRQATHKANNGIIPPHMEGTKIPGIRTHTAENHPSAYGGYTKQNQRFSVVDG